MKTAYFVKYPRTVESLQKPHPINHERPYEVVSQISLPPMDYKNFITDMRADRQFIEDVFPLCAEGEVMKCLLVKCRSKAGSVLVVPEYRAYVKWAAYTIEAN